MKDFSDGCGYKFEVVVVSSQFEGKPLLQRHRLVVNRNSNWLVQTILLRLCCHPVCAFSVKHDRVFEYCGSYICVCSYDILGLLKGTVLSDTRM